MRNLNSVLVMFENPEYNYRTSVSIQSTKESCEKYFVGSIFNMGVFPIEDMQECIGIKFN